MKKSNKQTAQFKIMPYFWEHKFKVVFNLILVVLVYAVNVLITFQGAKFLAEVAEFNFKFAFRAILVLTLLQIFNELVSLLINWIYHNLVADVTLKMKKDLIARTFEISSKSFSNAESGAFIGKICYDPINITLSVNGFTSHLLNLIQASFILIYISFLNIWIGLIMFAAVIVLALVEKLRNKLLKKNGIKERKLNDKITSLVNEIVKSEKDVKSLSLESGLEQEEDARFKGFKKVKVKKDYTNTSLWNVQTIIVSLAIFAIAVVSLNALEMNVMTLASLMFVYTNRFALGNAASSFGNIAESFTNIKVSKTRINELYDERYCEVEKFGDANLDNFSGKISFKNVKFAYDDGKLKFPDRYERTVNKQAETPVKKTRKKYLFKDLSFEIKPNTTVAFVGRSGSGKSTILNLIAKLYDVNGGEILFDETNINDLSKQAIRSNVSLVNQFPYIFDDTIERNLKIAKMDATKKEIIDACKKADFWDFVKTLPMGLDTKVGEGGIKLSGGQKQRLAMSRAFLRMTKIIIFDESTSSLDNFSQEEVKKSIDALKGKSTVIVVAHRLSTIENADTIYFLDKGKIVDSGSFKLLYRTNKEFQNMYTVEKLS